MVEGEVTLNFRQLESNGTVYEGGYTKDNIVIRRFWDVVHEFNEDIKRKFLRFVTGASRPPMGGLGNLEPKLKIQKNGVDSDLLPTAATCFNTYVYYSCCCCCCCCTMRTHILFFDCSLLLPEYATRSKMKEKLLVAVENASGFGLE